jgi:hypothetical protein
MAKSFAINLLAAAVVLGGALAVAGFADPASSATNIPTKEGTVKIEGTATIYGNWACKGQASVTATPGNALEPVPGFPGGVKKTVVKVVVHDIECGDGTMNKHLRKALKEKDNPTIKFETDKYTLLNKGGAVKAFGELSIAGVPRPVELDANLTALPEGGVRVVGQVGIQMKDYRVKPPSLLFGTLKVANDVTVSFDTEIVPPVDLQQSAALEVQ